MVPKTEDPGFDPQSGNEILHAAIKSTHATRPFRYDLNQIPFDYTVEGTRSDRQSA